jgi:RND family efflux transporter MFP subunit
MLRLTPPLTESGNTGVRIKAQGAAAALSILLAVSLPTGCHKKEASADSQKLPVAHVRVQIVESKKRLATEDVVGTVRAKLHAAIEAKVSGRIEKMLVAPGQTVTAGELLAQLDAREIQARLDQSLVLREQYARDTERLRRLLTDSAVSRQEFETVESHYRVAAASVTEGETMLGYTKIVAPFDGVVTRKLADVGDLATPGRTLLEIDDPKALRLEADVPEALIKRVQLGAKLEVRLAAQDDAITGVVSEIAPIADPASRTFNVKLDLPGGAGLQAGQFARVTVPVGETHALRVPASAVVQRGQMELVFVVVEDRTQLRLVKSGKHMGNEIELVSGVSPGEQVVAEGASQLHDGQPVEVKP